MLNQEIETIRESFEDFSSDLEDHRLARNKLHSIEEILFFGAMQLTPLPTRCSDYGFCRNGRNL